MKTGKGGGATGGPAITLSKTRNGVRWAEESTALPLSLLGGNSVCSMSCGRAADFLRRRRYHKKNKANVTIRKPQAPATMPPIAPPLNLNNIVDQQGGKTLKAMISTHGDERRDAGASVDGSVLAL